MSLCCPKCGCDRFEQGRITTYEELYVVTLTDDGEIADQYLEEQNCQDEEPSGPYRCGECGWELVDQDGHALLDPEEIVNWLQRNLPQRHAPSHIREALQAFLDAETPSVQVDNLEWFKEQLTDCTDTLPGVYCDQLDLPRGSSYGEAVQVLSSRKFNDKHDHA